MKSLTNGKKQFLCESVLRKKIQLFAVGEGEGVNSHTFCKLRDIFISKFTDWHNKSVTVRSLRVMYTLNDILSGSLNFRPQTLCVNYMYAKKLFYLVNIAKQTLKVLLQIFDFDIILIIRSHSLNLMNTKENQHFPRLEQWIKRIYNKIN